MYEKQFIKGAIERSAETAVDRRKLLTIFGLAGAGAAAATVAGGSAAFAKDASDGSGPSDASVLNFALNLEYLEAEFYLRAAFGHGLTDRDIHGTGAFGAVKGGRKVAFKSSVIRKYAEEIALDEQQHVRFLRRGLGGAAVARPALSLDAAFTAAATAAGVIKQGEKFDAFANDTNFLLAAYLFEDVGVSAYKGAARFLSDAPTFLEAAAGILAVEAYHAGIVRTVLFEEAQAVPSIISITQKISDARDSLSGIAHYMPGLSRGSMAGIVPTDKNGIVYSAAPGQVLNIVYLNPKATTKGGFYPAGVNGDLNTSASH